MMKDSKQTMSILTLQNLEDLPAFRVVQKIPDLAELKQHQFRCERCHEVQHKASKARHAKNCEPAFLMSQIKALFNVQSDKPELRDSGTQTSEAYVMKIESPC